MLTTYQAKAVKEWKEGIYLAVDGKKECSLGVYNENKSSLSLILTKAKSGKRSIRLQLRSHLDLSNKGGLVANLKFTSKNKKTINKRVRFIPYSTHDSKVFILNAKTITEESFKELMDLMVKFDTLNVIAFDKKWVEYNLKFSLKNSKNIFQTVFLKCN
jgi:hypothetical protein